MQQNVPWKNRFIFHWGNEASVHITKVLHGNWRPIDGATKAFACCSIAGSVLLSSLIFQGKQEANNHIWLAVHPMESLPHILTRMCCRSGQDPMECFLHIKTRMACRSGQQISPISAYRHTKSIKFSNFRTLPFDAWCWSVNQLGASVLPVCVLMLRTIHPELFLESYQKQSRRKCVKLHQISKFINFDKNRIDVNQTTTEHFHTKFNEFNFINVVRGDDFVNDQNYIFCLSFFRHCTLTHELDNWQVNQHRAKHLLWPHFTKTNQLYSLCD